MNKKVPTLVTHSLAFIFGFLMNFSGFLDNLTSIPSSYNEFKKVYLYDVDLMQGRWSTNPEYLLDGKDLGLIDHQPLTTITFQVDSNGAITGEILSRNLCNALSLAWVITIESPEPKITSFIVDKEFFIKRLKGGRMETVATLKLVDRNEKKKTLKFKSVDDRYGIFPEYITLAKDLPAFDADFKKLTDYCGERSKKFIEKVNRLLKDS